MQRETILIHSYNRGEAVLKVILLQAGESSDADDSDLEESYTYYETDFDESSESELDTLSSESEPEVI